MQIFANRFGLLWLLICLLPLSSKANPQNPAAITTTDSALQAQIGFGGAVKLGHWSPVFCTFPHDWQPTKFTATTLDGAGVSISYEGELVSSTPGSAQAWIKLGRSIGNVKIELSDDDDTALGETEISLTQNNKLDIVESTMPLILCIEPDKTITQDIASVANQLFGTECKVIQIGSADLLPVHPLPLQGIQVIYLTTWDMELVQSISPKQWQAIENWVIGGGKLVVSLGPQANELRSIQTFANLIPGSIDGNFEIKNSIQFERYARSKPPQLLSRGDTPIAATKLTADPEAVELAVGKNPLVVRKAYGFGQVVCSTVDFSTAPLTEWNGHKKFLMRLTYGQLNLNRTSEITSDSRNVVSVGYGDILGQIIFPLERFSQVSFINFTVVAILIALFLLCIGPGDYFLLKKTIGKMEWTWLTFSMLVAGFCGLAVFISNATKPNEAQINQLEIIDIDTVGDNVRGSVWTNIYSPKNCKIDLTAPQLNSLGIDTGDATLAWMGIPGEGLGGMGSKTNPGLLQQNYQCVFETGSAASQLKQLPINVSSTKSLFTQYSGQQDFQVRSRLKTRRNRLTGTFKNPFDFRLEDCRIVFDNWVYVLKAPLEGGDTVDVGSNFQEKTTTSYFSRRTDTESDKGGSQPWDPEESNMERLAEMMMFFELGGGRQYTRLTHGYQPQLDLSELLNLDRAVFIGRFEEPSTKLNLSSDSSEFEYDQNKTYVRIVLPVDNQSTKSQNAKNQP